jgi:hypothetical protein
LALRTTHRSHYHNSDAATQCEAFLDRESPMYILSPKMSLILILPEMTLLACASPPGEEEEEAGSSTITTGTTGSTGVLDNGADADSLGGTEGPQLPPTSLECFGTVNGPHQGAPFAVATAYIPLLDPEIDIREICPNATGALIANSVIYYPTVDDDWPEERVPLLVFTHGRGQYAEKYAYLFTAVAAMGVAVISVESMPTTSEWVREQSIACALSWAGWDDPDGGYALFEDHLTCDLIVGGHSNGGQAAWQFLRDRAPSASLSPYWFNFLPRAFFTFGTRHDAPPAPETLSPTYAAPYYALLGALDNDTRHDAITQYDSTPLEEEAGASLKIIHIVHDTSHNDVGGIDPAPVVATNQAQLAALDYLTRFIDWQVFDNNVEENRRVLLLEQFSADLVDSALWTNANGYGQLTGGAACASSDTPELCAERAGCIWNGATLECEDFLCEATPPVECDARWACAWDDANDECVDRPMIFANVTLGQTDTPRQRFQTFPDTSTVLQASPSLLGQYLVGPATDLDDDLEQLTYHNTILLRVDWGDIGAAGGTVTIPYWPNWYPSTTLDVSSSSYHEHSPRKLAGALGCSNIHDVRSSAVRRRNRHSVDRR